MRKKQQAPLQLKYVKALGVELEGGWIKSPPGLQDEYIRINGREHYNTKTGKKLPPHGYHVPTYIQGEIPSPTFNTIKEMATWLHYNYPDAVNSSCGLHVHISLTTPHAYLALADQKFFSYFRRQLKAWAKTRLPEDHDFWPRFNGRVHYCKPINKAIEQIQEDSTDRFVQLNFVAYHAHHTIENRLLPAFETPILAEEAITKYISVVEEYLEKNYKTFLEGKKFTEVVHSPNFKVVVKKPFKPLNLVYDNGYKYVNAQKMPVELGEI